MQGKSNAEKSDDDETSEPAPLSAPVTMGYTEELRQLVYVKGLGEEHAAALTKLETALIRSAVKKQKSITEFFVKSVFFFAILFFKLRSIYYKLMDIGNEGMPLDAQVHYKWAQLYIVQHFTPVCVSSTQAPSPESSTASLICRSRSACADHCHPY